MIRVGDWAPEIKADAVMSDGSIRKGYDFMADTEGKYRLVFFYPLDFTFVCPTELIALHKRMDRFTALNTAVAAVSIDSVYSHLQWRNTPLKQGGIGPVNYTLLADVSHQLTQTFGVESKEGMAYRGAFIIDPKNTVRVAVIHDLPLGRNIDELLRVIEACQFHEKNGEVCPAGWSQQDAGMIDTPDGVKKYLKDHADTL